MAAQAKKKSSVVWDFFNEDPEEKLYAVCLKCNQRIKRGVTVDKCSSTPLHNHLRSKHANDFSHALKRKSNEENPENQPPLKQQTIQESLENSSYPPNSPQYLSITRSIALDCQPYSIVTDEGFKTLMQVAKPRYVLHKIEQIVIYNLLVVIKYMKYSIQLSNLIYIPIVCAHLHNYNLAHKYNNIYSILYIGIKCQRDEK